MNPNNAVIDSAITMDKIIGITSDTFTAKAFNVGGYLYQYTIPHSLTRPAFLDGLFSLNDTSFVPNGYADATNSYQVYSDSSNHYFLTTANSGLIYYKLVETWIDNFDTTNPLVTTVLGQTLPTVSNSTYYDSRANYQKLFKSDVVPLTNPGVGVTGTYTINHNLGYKPRYKVFFESLPGQVWPAISGGSQDAWLYDTVHQYECYAVSDTSTITVSYIPGSSSAATFRIWYRVYYDQ